MNTSEVDVRWKQRFQNYGRALKQLTKFMEKVELNELEEQGLIQSFEYNHELAWKTLKDFLEFRGGVNLFGSRDTTKEAFKTGLLGDNEECGTIWMDMIKSRNQTSHTYNEQTTLKIIEAIRNDYFSAFIALHEKLKSLMDA
ncbi:MAG: nucleotidyltransferase substrate binding protein [Emcibacteraceae bacterium]|nr:nucleotidyltransferase substrate binding protein [Emcibacteraceae bacterium]